MKLDSLIEKAIYNFIHDTDTSILLNEINSRNEELSLWALENLWASTAHHKLDIYPLYDINCLLESSSVELENQFDINNLNKISDNEIINFFVYVLNGFIANDDGTAYSCLEIHSYQNVFIYITSDPGGQGGPSYRDVGISDSKKSILDSYSSSGFVIYETLPDKSITISKQSIVQFTNLFKTTFL